MKGFFIWIIPIVLFLFGVSDLLNFFPGEIIFGYPLLIPSLIIAEKLLHINHDLLIRSVDSSMTLKPIGWMVTLVFWFLVELVVVFIIKRFNRNT